MARMALLIQQVERPDDPAAQYGAQGGFRKRRTGEQRRRTGNVRLRFPVSVFA